MKKIFYLAMAICLPMMFVCSCSKDDEKDGGNDGLKGYYIKYQLNGRIAYGVDYDFYRAFYLNGDGNGIYYWSVTDKPGYYKNDKNVGESELVNGYYYQTGQGNVMTYTKVGKNINVVCPAEGTFSFEISSMIFKTE